MLCCRNAKIALGQIRHSMIGKFTFVTPGLTMCDLNNIRIELLRFHCSICFKIEKAQLYPLKQIIVFNDTAAIAAIIHYYAISILRYSFSLCSIPVLIEHSILHYFTPHS